MSKDGFHSFEAGHFMWNKNKDLICHTYSILSLYSSDL